VDGTGSLSYLTLEFGVVGTTFGFYYLSLLVNLLVKLMSS
jgi:hypothetical protein